MCKCVNVTLKYKKCKETGVKHTTTSRKVTHYCHTGLGLSCPDLVLDTDMVLGSSTSLNECPLCPT